MVASILRIQSALNFLINAILICYCHSQISKFCQLSQRYTSYLWIMILSCILMVKQESY